MKEVKDIPALRFPEFVGVWGKTRLGDVSNFISKGTTPKSFTDKGINFIKIESLNGIHVLKEKCLCIDEKTHYGELKRSILEDGDILFAIAGATVGKIGIVTKEILPANTNQALAIIRLKDKKTNPFLLQVLESRGMKKYIFQSMSVGAQPNLNLKQINDFEFKAPSTSEQTKIANFLTTVDERINLLSQQKEKLEQYKKGVMQQIFSQQLRFKDDDGKEFPKWEEKRLGEIGSTYNGLTGKTKEDFGEGKMYVQYMQIFSSTRIKLNMCGLVQIQEGEKQSMIQRGDVFFTTSSETPNEIGMSSVLVDEVDEVFLNSFCFGYRPNSIEIVVPEFAQYLFRSAAIRRKIIRLAQGSTRFNMSKVELMKQSIELPSNKEQQKIATFLSSIDKKIELVNQQIEQSKTWKKGLLQKMFV